MPRESTGNLFGVEELEPRVMLSATPLVVGTGAALLGTGQQQPLTSQVDVASQISQPADVTTTSSSDMFSGMQAAPTVTDATATGGQSTSSTTSGQTATTTQTQTTDSTSTTSYSAELSPAYATSTLSATSVDNSGATAQQLTKSLVAANGPPSTTQDPTPDLQTYINNLLASNTSSFTSTKQLSAVSLGGMLELTNVQLVVTATLSQSGWSGTVTIAAGSGTLFYGKSFSASITSSTSASAVTGSYTIGGTYSLTVPSTATLTLNVGQALKITASNINLAYDPNGTTTQTLATVANATVNSPQFSGFANGTLTNFDLRADGFSFDSFSLTSSAPSLNGIITATAATLTVSNFNVSFGDGTNPASLTGTVGLTLSNVALYPTGGLVQFSATSVTPSYDFSSFDGTSATGQLTIDISGFTLGFGNALQVTTGGTDVVLTPGQATMATIATATVSSPQFSGLGSFQVTNLALNQTGFTIGNATWSSTGSVSIGSIVKADSVTLTLSNFGLQYGTSPTVSGSISVSAPGFVLFPTVPLLDVSLGTLSGTYVFGDAAHPAGYLKLQISSLDIPLGDALTIHLGAVNLTPGLSPIVQVADATVTGNLFSGLPTVDLGAFELTSTGFTLGTFNISDSSAVTIGNFFSLSSLTVSVKNFAVDVSQVQPISGTITVTLGTLTLFPGAAGFNSTFTNLTGSYDFSSATSPGQFSFNAGSISLSIGGQFVVTANGVTLTPGAPTIATIDNATLTFAPLNDLAVTINGLVVQSTGVSIASATATLTTNITLGSILTIQAPTITLTDVDYVSGGGLTGTVGFSSGGASLALGSALDTSTSGLTGTYDLGTGTLNASLDSFSLTLAGFATFSSGPVDISYTPQGDGTATMLVGATGMEAFLGTGTGSSRIGIDFTGGTLALAIFKDAQGNITYALDAQGSLALLGMPAGSFSVNSGNVEFRLDTAGAVSETITAGTTTLQLNFTGNETSIFARNLSISVGTFVTLSGDFGFSEVTPAGGPTYIAIGASNVTATVSAGAASVTMTGGSLGLLIQPGGPTTPTTYALVANGGTDSLNGVTGLTLTGTGLEVRVRNGLDPTAVTGLPTQIETPDGNVSLDFSNLGSGTGNITDVEGTATLAIKNFVSITGSFGFQQFTDGSSTFLAVGASDLTIVLGTATTNLTIDNASLGLVIEPGSGGNPAKYALEAKGGSAPLDASLNGVPNVILSGSNLLVRVRQGLDLTGDTAVPTSVQTPNGPVTLDFSGLGSGTTNLADIEGHLTLSVTGFGSIEGDFGFQTFTDGATGMTEWAVGATGVTVTVGTATTNLTVSDASLALLVRPGEAPNPTTYALEATAGSATLNGTGDLSVSASSLLVRIRQGLDLSTASGLPTTVQTSGGTAAFDFSGLPAGSSNLIDVEGSVTLTVGTFVTLGGNFGIQSYTDGTNNYLEFGGTGITATLTAGSVNLTLANATLGVVVEQGPTPYYAVEAKGSSNPADTSLNGVTGLTLNASNLLVRASNGLDVSTLPATLPTAIHTSGGDVTLDFSGLAGSGSTPVTDIEGHLTLAVAGFANLEGDFGFQKFTDGSGGSDLAIGALNVNAVLGTPTVNVTVADASLALLVKPGTGYDLVAQGGKDTLNGVTGLSVSASGLTVQSNQGLDPSQVSGIPQGVETSGGSANFDFTGLGASGTTSIDGQISLNVANFVSLTGQFTFTQETSGTLTKILVGATGVDAFVGSADHSFGVQITGASLGLVIYRDTTTSGSTYALDASVPSIKTFGLPTGFTLTGGISVAINTTGQAVSETIGSNGYSINFTDGTNGTPDQTNIRTIGGNLTFGDGSIFTVTGDFSFTQSVSGGLTTLLIGAANVGTAANTSITADGGAGSFTLSNGTLGLIIFSDGTYALTASGTATATGGSALSASATLTIRINTTTSQQNETVTVGTTTIPVVFSSTEVATGTSIFKQILLGNTSLSLDNTLIITAGQATAVAGTNYSSIPLTSVSLTLQNPNASEVLFKIGAGSATYTSFSGTVTPTDATNAGLPVRADNNNWVAGDKDLVLTNVTFSIGSIVTFTAQKIDVQHFTSGTGTTDAFEFTGTTITFYAGGNPMVSVSGSASFHFSTADGFKLDSFTVSGVSFLGGPDPLSNVALGPITLTSPSVSLSNFDFGFGSGTTADLSARITILAATATIGSAASPVHATLTNVSGSFDVTVGFDLANLTAPPSISANGFSMRADSFSIAIGQFLTISATGTPQTPLTFNPSAGPTQTLISFASLTATLKVGGVKISGTASNFSIDGNGSFVAGKDFGVSITLGQNGNGDASSTFDWPSWFPLQSASVTLVWSNFNSDPTNFLIELSASVSLNSIKGVPLTVSGSVTDMVIDPSLIGSGQFPVISIGSATLTVKGNLFGGEVDGTLIVGVVRFDANGALVDGLGNLVGTTTPGTGPITNVFYGGIEASFSIGGMAGFTIRVGLSQYGPLQIYVAADVAIPLGDTGLFLSDFRGGVDFSAQFPTITISNPPQASDALQLRQPGFSTPTSLTTAQWEAQLQQQVVTQFKNGVDGWNNLGKTSMIIQAGVTIYEGSPDAFRIDADVFFDTSGRFLVVGTATFGNSLSIGVKMYADLGPLINAIAANQNSVSLNILFLMEVPSQNTPNPISPPIYSLYGVATFSYANSVFQLSIAGAADLNVLGGLQAHVEATLTLTFTSNSFTVTLSDGNFYIPQIQSAALGTASGSLTIETVNGTTEIWGGFLLSANLTGLQAAGITFPGNPQMFIKLNTTGETQTVTLSNSPTPLTLNPESFSLFINGKADFAVDGQQAFELSGTLDFEIANGSLTLFVQASLLMGPDPSNPILTFNASGLIFIQMVKDTSVTPNIPVGFAAKVTLTMGKNATTPNGISFGMDFLLVVNTTGVQITYIIPAPVPTNPPSAPVPTVMGPDYSSSDPLAQTSYETTVTIGGVSQRALVIPNGPPAKGLTNYANWTPVAPNTPYLIILGRGNLTIADSFTLTGDINIVASSGNNGFTFTLDANATLDLKANGTTVFVFQATGGLEISDAGVVAAISVTLPGGVPAGLHFGLKNASFLLELNTTGQQATVDAITVPAGTNDTFAEVQVTGDMVFLGGVVDLNGTFDLTVTGGSLTIAVDANITFLNATFHASGFAGIYYDAHPGVALRIQLSLPGGAQGIAPVPALGSNFVIKGTFTLAINTSSVTRYDQNNVAIPPGFSVSVSNLGVYLFGFNLTGSLSISITPAGFGINIPYLDLNLFGFANIKLSGYYLPDGSFSFTGSAGFQFGDHTFGIGGTINVTISNSGFAANVNGWVAAFGVQINGGGAVKITNGSVDISVYIYVVVIPAVHTPAVVAWGVTVIPAVNTPAVVVSGTAHFHLGSTSPAPTVAQATPPPPPQPPPPQPPALAGVTNGVLSLFLGSDVSQRVNASGTETGPQAAEDYTLTLGSNANTVIVSALGFTQTFTGVTSIKVANTLTGNDTITISNKIDLPVNITLGSGNNTITTGSGAATVDISGDGANTVTAGDSANITIDGSGINHASTGSNSTVTINGGGANHVTTGDGANLTIAGTGANTVSTGAGSTVVISGGGANVVTTNGGSAPFTISGNGDSTVTVNNGGTFSFDVSGTGANSITITDGSPTVDLEATASGANQISISTSGTNRVTIAGNGNNQVTVTGTGATAITVTGDGSNQITTGAGSATITLQGSGTNNVTTGAGAATIYDQGTGGTFVQGGSGGGSFFGGVTAGGSAFSSKGASSLTAPAGNFTVQISGYSDYLLTDSYLGFGSYSLSISGVHQVTLIAGSTTAANKFTLAGWTGNATLDGAGSDNTVVSTPAAGVANLAYVLSDAQLQVTGDVNLNQTIALSGIQTADLYGGPGINSFDVSGWTGGGQLVGLPDTFNSVVASGDAAVYSLTDSSLGRTGDGTMALTGIQQAILLGGTDANTFDVSNWSGIAYLNGEGGNDIYNLTLSGTTTGEFTVADTGISSGDVLNITGSKNFFVTANQVRDGTEQVAYSGIEKLNLIGAADGLNYYVQSTAAGVATSVETGGPASFVDVGSTAGQVPSAPGVLSTIQGTLSVSGGGTMLVDNTGSNASQSGTLTPTSLTGFGMGPGGVQYQDLSLLMVNLGSGGNTLAIQNIDPATHTVVDGGSSANDTVNATFTGNFNGRLDLTGFEHGTLVVAGNFNGTLNDTGPGHLESVQIDGSLTDTGVLVAGSIDTMSVGQDLAGQVTVSGTLGALTVTGAVSGTVTESGTITTLSIGSLTSTGQINAVNAADPSQYSTDSLGNILTMTVGQDLAGRVSVSGNVGSLAVDGDLSGTVAVQGALDTLNVSGNVSGSVSESGPMTLVSILGNLAASGTITAVNTAPTVANIATFNVGQSLAGVVLVSGSIGKLEVGGDLSGSVTESGEINLLTIGGSLTSTGVITASNPTDPTEVSSPLQTTLGNIDTMTVGGDLAGQVTVTGNLNSLSVGGDLSGAVLVQNTLSALDVTGDVSGTVTESGTVATLSIGGSLTAAGIITSGNVADPAQVPGATLGNIITMTVGHDLAGQVIVSGNLGQIADNTGGLTVGTTTADSLSGTVTVGNTLTNLMVTGDVSGQVTESGTVTTLTIGGSLGGTITASNTADPAEVPGTTLANIDTLTVGGDLAGQVTVTGNLNSLNVGGNLSGGVLVQNTLSTLDVTGDVSGTVSESGTIGTLTIGGSLTSTGSITASNSTDPNQLPPVDPPYLGNITTMSVGGDLAGNVFVTGDLGSLSVGQNLSGTVLVQNTLDDLSVTNDVSGSVTESGTIDSVTIGGSLTVTGSIAAVNVTPTLANITTLTIGQDFAGSVTVSGTLQTLTITNGQMTPTAQLKAGNLGTFTIGPDHLSVGQNLAGVITVSGTLQSLRVAGGTPGTIIAGHIGTIAVYGGFGPVVLNVTENGIQRLVEATTPTQPYPLPNPQAVAVAPGQTGYVNFQFYYESGRLANPQLTVRVTNGVSTAADQYDLSLITYNDAAKFNLARLDASGIAGVRNVVVEGDLLTAVSPQAAAFFMVTGPGGTMVQDATPAGIRLPADHLAGVSIRDFAPNGYIQAASIQGVAFGSFSYDGQILTGAEATALDAAGLLAPGTQIVQAADIFRVAFADLATQHVALFIDTAVNSGHFDNDSILFAVQSVVTANADGTANVVTPSNVARGAATAFVTVMPTDNSRGNTQASVVDTIAINGDGASIQTRQWISQGITSGGPLGDLILQSGRGITNITAPAIFGSIVSNGPLTGTIQTTGQRIDPITGDVTTVAADIGRLYVVPGAKSGDPVQVVATTIQVQSVGVGGRLISRGNLVSSITTGGGISGVIAVQGNLGMSWMSAGSMQRFGGLVGGGSLSGTIVVLGQQIGDVTFNGGFTGGDYAVAGGILGNLTINGGLDSASKLVSGGQIGSASLGTALNVGGDNKGIIAAMGPITYAKNAPKGYVFDNAGADPTGPNAMAINAIFTPLSPDINPLDLGGLAQIQTSLNNLYVNSQGNLADTGA